SLHRRVMALRNGLTVLGLERPNRGVPIMTDASHTRSAEPETMLPAERGMKRRDLLKSGVIAASSLSAAHLLAACGGGGGGAGVGGGVAGGAPRKAVRGGTLMVAMPTAGRSETLSVWQCYDFAGTA